MTGLVLSYQSRRENAVILRPFAGHGRHKALTLEA